MDDHAKDERIERFVRLGVITRACHPGSPDRAGPPPDLPVLRPGGGLLRRFGFVVSAFGVQLREVCRECREQEDKR